MGFLEVFEEHPDSFVLGGLAVICVALGSLLAGRDAGNDLSDVLTEGRAKAYPWIAGAALTSLNMLIEKLGPKTVNWLMSFYFGLAGSNSIWFLLRTFIPLKGKKLFTYPKSRTILSEFILPPKPIPFRVGDIPLYLVGILINILYYKTFDNITNNIIAMSISTFAVMSIRIEKFTAAAPMLWGLLLYDVFFVYQTDVMTSVAVNLRGPIKLLYSKGRSDSVLGLGDIVLPGMFLSVCSRFDTFLYKLLGKRGPYWTVAMIGYVLALALTDIVCSITGDGQPALLFITPMVTIPVIALAFYRREHYAFMSFSG